jgi:2-polyprenyl-3-methyl-5-hydroxy-6-metoxy-1,4-benzoquinol methylase
VWAPSLAAPGAGRRPALEPWNHNWHYHRAVLAALPRRCGRALDVGCGQGGLTRRLRQVVPHVTGIDRDQRSIQLARAHPEAADIRYLLGDFLATAFEPGSLDFVTAVASLHHKDAEMALQRMAELLRPGGVLAVVGLARESWSVGLGLNIDLGDDLGGLRIVVGEGLARSVYAPMLGRIAGARPCGCRLLCHSR